ncbi:hypothetical protein NMG60_11027839 [Bertholletia excelsa]
MLSRLPPLLRTAFRPPISTEAMAARAVSAGVFYASAALRASSSSPHSSLLPSWVRFRASASCLDSSVFGWSLNGVRCDGRSISRVLGKVFASQRGYRKVRRKAAKSKEGELELNIDICIEEQLPDDPEIQGIAEMLRLDVPVAIKLAFDGVNDAEYKTRDSAIDDIDCFQAVELSVLLCNDEFIRKLNKEWRDEDHATDVLSMSQHMPELKLPILMLGDIVISVETAARQAEERRHTLLDEIRVLVVHGLLHLLGFDHEISEEAEAEMEKEEEVLLRSLGWKGKGLIQSAHNAETNGSPHTDDPDDRRKEGSLQFTNQSSVTSSVIWTAHC